MRFFVTGEQNRQLLINSLILMFLVYVALLWVSNGLMYFHKMSLTVESVVAFYLGSEEAFTQPRSYQSLLEVTHFHLFAMGMLVLTLTHLMLMTSLPTLMKVWLSGIIYAAALADEAAGWLVRFVDPRFAYFKIAAFLTLEASLLALIVIVSISLIQSRQRIQ
ncbi:hypothetical protein [Methylomonas sp. UP202]|uniref:hypothetical protein n=1 Tax=Methylomonas sp. UP202 TaxID=3040943 RepID=UPI00247AA58D|nr:hypothetical protein [Methylomonas sp. UP202]WGS87548.1 hypothetical protein QC632_07260 [Methylomonas sp. UP202]